MKYVMKSRTHERTQPPIPLVGGYASRTETPSPRPSPPGGRGRRKARRGSRIQCAGYWFDEFSHWFGRTALPGLVLLTGLAGQAVSAAVPVNRFTVKQFDVPGAVHTVANTINNAGSTAGEWYNADYSVNKGFVRNADGSTVIVEPAETYGGISISGLNNRGDVAGFMESDAYVRYGTNFSIIRPTGAGAAYGRGINDSGVVVGDATGPNGNFNFVYDGTNAISLEIPGALQSGFVDINNAGDILAYAVRRVVENGVTNQINRNGLLRGTDFTEITYPDSTLSALSTISDNGVILGLFRQAATGSTNRYFLYEQGQFTEVQFAGEPGWSRYTATDINDSGAIVGHFRTSDNAYHGFVATPKPELRTGHTDLSFTYTNGTFVAGIHRDDADFQTEEAVLVVPQGTFLPVPDDQRFRFLGVPPAGVWILPEAQDANFLFLGLRTEVQGAGFTNDEARVWLVNFEGPGQFTLFNSDPIGTPMIYMNTADGITDADTASIVYGHAHYNWTFSQPGSYRLTFEASGTLTNGTVVKSDPVSYAFTVEGTNINPAVLDRQHVDIGFAFENGEWEPHLHNETDETEYAPNGAVLSVRPQSFTRVPDDARFAFLGGVCTPIWQLPNTQNSNLLFLGFGAEEIEQGVFLNDEFRVNLLTVDGPGSFFVYDFDPLGAPIVHMNSGDLIDTNDFKTLVAGAHNDLNWAFTAPGVYRVTFEAVGTLTNGTIVSSGPAEYIFFVEASPTPLSEPLLAISRSGGNTVTLSWEGNAGAMYQLQSTSNLFAGWTNQGAPIVGMCTVQTATLSITDAARFFRVAATNSASITGASLLRGTIPLETVPAK
jgi:surface-anchored protein